MRIAEAAARSGLSIDTIRYYEKSGMLPAVSRLSNGDRDFSPENVEWLTLLYWLRETGMAMKTMYRFASLYKQGDHTIPERKTLLLQHSDLLKKRKLDLDRCEELLSYKLEKYKDIET